MYNNSGSENVSLEERKLFIGGLGWDTTEKQLEEYFGKFGDIESTSLKTNPTTGRSRGFAFVVFGKSETVDAILDGTEHVINGRKVDAKKAIARTGKIFVGGLKPEISDDDIRNYFGQFGKVVDLEVPFDKTKNTRKGFCFVTFEQEQVVNELLRSPQKTINGLHVDLRRATPKTDAPGAIRGGYGGYGPYGGGGSYGGYGGGYGGRGGFGRGRGGAPYSGGYGWSGPYDADPYAYGDYGTSYGSGSSYGAGGGYGGYDYSNGYGGSYGDYSDYGGYESYGRGGRQGQSRHQPY